MGTTGVAKGSVEDLNVRAPFWTGEGILNTLGRGGACSELRYKRFRSWINLAFMNESNLQGGRQQARSQEAAATVQILMPVFERRLQSGKGTDRCR